MLARRVREQRQHQRGRKSLPSGSVPRVYSLHAPEVEWIGKGKAHRPYEFGVKGGFRREVQPRRQHWFLNEKSGFPFRTPAFCSVSRGQRRFDEKEYRAPSVTPGLHFAPELRKVSLATTLHRSRGGQFIAHAKALPGNPYAGHTLAAVIPDEAQIGVNLTRIVADRGYRGHNAPPDHKFRVYISGQRRRVTEAIKREP